MGFEFRGGNFENEERGGFADDLFVTEHRCLQN